MVKISGKEVDAAGKNLVDVLKELGYEGKHFVVEYNEEIIPKENYAEITLKDNDVVEVVSFMGGGSK